MKVLNKNHKLFWFAFVLMVIHCINKILNGEPLSTLIFTAPFLFIGIYWYRIKDGIKGPALVFLSSLELNYILSNHIPEMQDGLGVSDYIGMIYIFGVFLSLFIGLMMIGDILLNNKEKKIWVSDGSVDFEKHTIR
jgi:hypothetical protein